MRSRHHAQWVAVLVLLCVQMTVINAQNRPPGSGSAGGGSPEPENVDPNLAIEIRNRLAAMSGPAPEREFDRLPDSAAVVSILHDQVACKALVGGKYVGFIFQRLRNTTYWEYWIVAARKWPNGRVQVWFGTAVPEARVIALFQPYWQPTTAWLSGTEQPRRTENLLPDMEHALGFKEGSLTVTIVRVLTILHEQAHLNDAIPRDDLCLAQSMLNTRKIAEACYPEIVQPLALQQARGACPVPVGAIGHEDGRPGEFDGVM